MIRSPRVNVLLVINVGLLWFLSLLVVGKLWAHEHLRRTKAEIRVEQLERQLKHAETLVAIDPRQP